MAFLLSYTRPITSSIWTFQKAWTRCLVAIPDFVRPPGPRSTWTRDEQNAYSRWRYATDAEYRNRKIQASSAYIKTRWENDPVWRQAKLKQAMDRYANDPKYREAMRQRFRDKWTNGAEFREVLLQRERERYANDPEYREAALQRASKRYADDAEFREAKRQRAKERYANDPEYRQAVLQRAKDRHLRRKAELAAHKDKLDFSQNLLHSQGPSDGPANGP